MGASGNTVRSNTASENGVAISVGQFSMGNSIHDNTALSSPVFDLEDGNPGCDSNAWTNNAFVTDNVAGASDGGPGTGCIQ